MPVARVLASRVDKIPWGRGVNGLPAAATWPHSAPQKPRVSILGQAYDAQTRGSNRKFWSISLPAGDPWTEAQVMGTVAPELAECEFDCSQSPCSDLDWVSCERRISRAARKVLEQA